MNYYALNLNQLSFEVGIDYTERRKTKRKKSKMFPIKIHSYLPQGELSQREKKTKKTLLLYFYADWLSPRLDNTERKD